MIQTPWDRLYIVCPIGCICFTSLGSEYGSCTSGSSLGSTTLTWGRGRGREKEGEGEEEGEGGGGGGRRREKEGEGEGEGEGGRRGRNKLVIHKSLLATLGSVPGKCNCLSLGETGILAAVPLYLVRKRFFGATFARRVMGKHDLHLDS